MVGEFVIPKPLLRSSFYPISKKQDRNLNYFWLGFILYTASYVISTTDGIFLNIVICQGFQFIGFAIVVYGSIKLYKYKFDSSYLGNLFTLYLLYSLIVVLRGIHFNYNSFKNMIFDPTIRAGLIPYLTPIVLLFPRNIFYYKKMYNALIFLGSIFSVFVVFFSSIILDPDRKNLLSQSLVENCFGWLAFPLFFLLLTYVYHVGKKGVWSFKNRNLFAFFVTILALYLLVYRARRGSIFLCLTQFTSIAMIYFIYSKNRFMMVFMCVFTVLVMALYFSGRSAPAEFGFLEERGNEDTRTPVEEYMKADMTDIEWVIGKGFNATYYCPIVENINDLEGNWERDMIETGYLQIILTGGVISLILLLLILFPAVYMGLFQSRNILSKASALWILFWILYLYPSTGIAFSMHYITVWVCVGICYSRSLRNAQDNELKHYLQN